MINILLILLSVLLNCAAQLLVRKGMLIVGPVSSNNLLYSIGAILSNLWLWGAMGCFLCSMVLWFIVLSRVEVSYAYMFNSLGYVIVTLGGYFLFQEQISLMRIIGMLVICVGVVIIANF